MDTLRRQYRQIKKDKDIKSGSLYTANNQNGKELIIKEIDLSKHDSQGEACKLKNALDKLVNQDNPNFPKILQVLDSQGKLFVVMEKITGPTETLEQYLEKKKPISFNQALQIICQIKNAYRTLYDKSVIHRNIYPGNILIRAEPDDNLKIFLTGQLRMLYVNMLESFSGAQVGSPLWVAPEVFQLRKYNSQADVFSLGTIFYQLLCNIHPIESVVKQVRSEADIINYFKIIQKTPLKCPTNKNLSKNIIQLVEDMLLYQDTQRITWLKIFSNILLNNDSYINKKNSLNSSNYSIQNSNGSLQNQQPSLNQQTSIDKSSLPPNTANHTSQQNNIQQQQQSHQHPTQQAVQNRGMQQSTPSTNSGYQQNQNQQLQMNNSMQNYQGTRSYQNNIQPITQTYTASSGYQQSLNQQTPNRIEENKMQQTPNQLNQLTPIPQNIKMQQTPNQLNQQTQIPQSMKIQQTPNQLNQQTPIPQNIIKKSGQFTTTQPQQTNQENNFLKQSSEFQKNQKLNNAQMKVQENFQINYPKSEIIQTQGAPKQSFFQVVSDVYLGIENKSQIQNQNQTPPWVKNIQKLIEYLMGCAEFISTAAAQIKQHSHLTGMDPNTLFYLLSTMYGFIYSAALNVYGLKNNQPQLISKSITQALGNDTTEKLKFLSSEKFEQSQTISQWLQKFSGQSYNDYQFYVQNLSSYNLYNVDTLKQLLLNPNPIDFEIFLQWSNYIFKTFAKKSFQYQQQYSIHLDYVRFIYLFFYSSQLNDFCPIGNFKNFTKEILFAYQTYTSSQLQQKLQVLMT